ncbi:hypothetical protein BIT28_14185 [Photobacterium proteolyticum]|uniref:Uncharacterized protein n=1 Tax=Photobacterium proteolyticum TaxID=1903952 RepID=A0A1Q9H1W0_9GAMM|nr:hypothetical protein [Photobacterium proteolyticum]OLQ81668.1 hypothetical protein BIT28_14185 [Photobacterium proteolyticum]
MEAAILAVAVVIVSSLVRVSVLLNKIHRESQAQTKLLEQLVTHSSTVKEQLGYTQWHVDQIRQSVSDTEAQN